MVDSPKTDLVMMFSIAAPDGISAESKATLQKGDDLTSAFKDGRFFDVEEFGFGMALKDDEGGGGKAEALKLDTGLSFARWRSVKSGQAEPTDLNYRCKPEPFTISRLVDTATPVLFKHCASRQEFERAILVKRSLINDAQGTIAFLKLEFGKVIITGMDWSDGEVVKETCHFSFRKLDVTYVKRKADGTKESSVSGNWHEITTANPKTS